MQRGGYSARAAGAIEAVASTGGQLTPPIMGAAAFLMAEFLQMPYQDIVLAAVIPALLFYVALFVHTDLEAARTGVTALEPDQIPAARKVLAGGWFLIVPFAVLIVVLFSLNQPAETAALAACGSLAAIALVFGYGARKLTPKAIVAALRDTGYAVVDIIVITAAAGIIIGILDRSGLSFGLGFVLVQFGENSLFLLLLLTAGVSILLGMGMPTTGVYFLLAALAAPPLIKLGVEPIAAHMYVLYFGMLSMITPPVAIAAFTRRQPVRRRADGDGRERGPVRLAGLCRPFPVRALADPADARRCAGDPARSGDRRPRRRCGDGRPWPAMP